MKIKNLFYTIGVMLLLFNCKEDLKGPLKKSNDIPNPPTNIKIENNAGSAIIRYDLPNDDNLLYVMAVFSSQEGTERVVKSSVFTNFVSLEGFGDSKEYNVSLFSVTRSEKRSFPVNVTIKPLRARVNDVFETLHTQTTFGGINMKFSNELQNEYVAHTLIKDSITGKWVEYDRLYTQAKDLDYSIRGFKSEPTDFAIYLTDKWNNNSDTLFTNLTPLFEIEFDKSLWKDAALSDDSNVPRYSDLSQLWTPGAKTYFFMSPTMPGLKLPNWFTIDLGRKYFFSRLLVNGVDHADSWRFAGGSPKTFEIWGSNLASTDWNNWTRLAQFECIKPSGLPLGTLSADDRAAWTAGQNYDFPIQPIGYRYIRFKTLMTFGGKPDVCLLELTFYGQPAN